jgi:hypothetical protein
VVHGGCRALSHASTDATRTPADHLPLYPYFLALCSALTGGSTVAVKLVQLLLGLVTVFFTYRIGQRVADRGRWRSRAERGPSSETGNQTSASRRARPGRNRDTTA